MKILIFVCMCYAFFSQQVYSKTTDKSFSSSIQEMDTLSSKIDKYLQKGLENGFSGTVLIAQNGQVILNKGYGYSDKDKNIHNTPETIFTTGSVSKQFTATAILKLNQMGLIELSDPISRFFENLPDDKRDITIHQLLTHSSGLVEVIGTSDFDHIETDAFFERLFATKLLHAPGIKYVYSNAGYSVLARIIEIVSTHDYEFFLYKHLFKPAGMENTGYLKPAWELNKVAKGYAYGYIDMGSLIERFQRDMRVSWVLKGNGGIHSTSLDMFKWYQALKSNKILNQALTAKLFNPYILEYEGEDSYYAYGWAIYRSPRNTKIISHNGGNKIFFHEFIWFPEEDTVVMFFTNASSRESEVTWPISKFLFDETYQLPAIVKNPRLFIYDFVNSYPPDQANKLLAKLHKNHKRAVGNGYIFVDFANWLLENELHDQWVLALLRLSTENFPNILANWEALGDAFKKFGKDDEAINAYLMANKLDPYLSSPIESLSRMGVKIEQKASVNIDESTLASYVGDYELRPGMHLTIALKDGQLTVKPTGRDEMLATVRSKTQFFVESANAYITFNSSTTGHFDSLSLLADGREMIAKRLDSISENSH